MVVDGSVVEVVEVQCMFQEQVVLVEGEHLVIRMELLLFLESVLHQCPLLGTMVVEVLDGLVVVMGEVRHQRHMVVMALS